MDPFEALDKSLKNQIILHPPQFVELSRMGKMASLDVLLDYAKKRQERGIHRWCPVQYMFKVLVLYIIPLHSITPEFLKNPAKWRIFLTKISRKLCLF